MRDDHGAKNVDPDGVPVARDTMLGDMIAFVVDELKAAPRVWQELSESQQETVLDRLRTRATSITNDVVRIIATGDKPNVAATLESVTVKDGIKAVLKISKGAPMRHDLMESTGCQVLIVIPEAYEGTDHDAPRADANQRPLDLGGRPPERETTTVSEETQKRENEQREEIRAADELVESISPDFGNAFVRAFAVRPKTGAARRLPAAGMWAVSPEEAWDLYCTNHPGYHAREEFYVEEVAPDLFDSIGCLNKSRVAPVDDTGKPAGADQATPPKKPKRGKGADADADQDAK
jgi:hypothetical protein